MAIALVPLASPAGAQPADPPDIETACENAEGAGFTDIGGSSLEAEINCLAAFDVTQGTSATEYSPAVQVRRSQMALFYYRVGQLAGLTWDTTDAGFTDLDGLGDDFVDAINALANAGIVQGTSEDMFSPQDRIRRSQMALFIDRFQEFAFGVAYSDDYTEDENVFPDIEELDEEAQAAVNGIGAVGITQGDASGDYVPSGFVSRQQMAAFIVRHLGQNGFEVPGPGITGTIIEAYDGTDYVFTDGEDIYTVTPDADAEFFVLGVPATETVFTAQATAGSEVTWNEDEDTHDVTNADTEAMLEDGLVVGQELNVDTVTPDDTDTNLIEPFSGATLVPAATDIGGADEFDDVASNQFRVGASTVDQADFLAAISFGDTLRVTESTNGDTIYTLNNGDITGTVDNASIGGVAGTNVTFDATTAGWTEYLGTGLGNDLAGTADFEITAAGYTGDTERYTIDGAPVNFDAAEAFITDADEQAAGIGVTYTRANGVERFSFSSDANADPADPVQGTFNGTYVGGTATNGLPATLDVLDEDGDVWTVSLGAIPILIDGTATSPTEIEGAIEAGADVTVIVEDDTDIDDTANTVTATDSDDLAIIDNP